MTIVAQFPVNTILHPPVSACILPIRALNGVLIGQNSQPFNTLKPARKRMAPALAAPRNAACKSNADCSLLAEIARRRLSPLQCDSAAALHIRQGCRYAAFPLPEWIPCLFTTILHILVPRQHFDKS